ncbi:flavin reductase family protein [Xanthobacter sp. TB0139]|uniref:flavin reductase family protein n=1 Tax=Xanthobacter sp. TB0139 TaxID=3459178 RepID=UPI00403A1895
MSREIMPSETASHELTPEAAAAEARRTLRRALGLFATGVCVVTTTAPSGERVGLTINSFSSVSLDPPLVLWSLARSSPWLELFRNASHFAVNVLSAEQEELCSRFSRPVEDRFAGLDVAHGAGKAPLLPGCLAHFECAQEQVVEAGDHIILLGRVLSHRKGDGADALVFCNGVLRSWPMALASMAASSTTAPASAAVEA